MLLANQPPSAQTLNHLFQLCQWDAAARTIPRTERYLRAMDACSCCLIEGKLVGFGKMSFDGYLAWLADIVVAPDYRRRGIGRAIVSDLLRVAKADFDATAAALLDQSGIAGFYGDLGFKAIADQPKLMVLSFEPGG